MTDDLERDLNVLLDQLCVQWGFCNDLRAAALLNRPGPLDADTFAEAVLAAEGFVPEHEPAWHRRLKRRFTDRYGASV